jgi:hypothetical protein
MIVVSGFLSSLGKIFSSTAFCLVDIECFAVSKIVFRYVAEYAKNRKTLDTIFILKQQWTDTYKIQGGVYIDVCGLENAVYFVNKKALYK